MINIAPIACGTWVHVFDPCFCVVGLFWLCNCIVKDDRVNCSSVKPVLNDHSQTDQKLVFKTDYHLMQVKSITECSKGNILQSAFIKPQFVIKIFVLSILSGRFTQDLLYFNCGLIVVCLGVLSFSLPCKLSPPPPPQFV